MSPETAHASLVQPAGRCDPSQCSLVHRLQGSLPRRQEPLLSAHRHRRYGRFLLGCIALPNTRFEGVQRALLTLFQTFGLPDAIRSDNGSPLRLQSPRWPLGALRLVAQTRRQTRAH
jgi:hypothetical protein